MLKNFLKFLCFSLTISTLQSATEIFPTEASIVEELKNVLKHVPSTRTTHDLNKAFEAISTTKSEAKKIKGVTLSTIFGPDESTGVFYSKAPLDQTTQLTFYQLAQQKNGDAKPVIHAMSKSIVEWLELRGACKSAGVTYFPVPRGRGFLELWSVVETLKKFHAEYLNFLVNQELEKDKNSFLKQKQLLEMWRANAEKSERRDLLEKIRDLSYSTYKYSWKVFCFLREFLLPKYFPSTSSPEFLPEILSPCSFFLIGFYQEDKLIRFLNGEDIVFSNKRHSNKFIKNCYVHLEMKAEFLQMMLGKLQNMPRDLYPVFQRRIGYGLRMDESQFYQTSTADESTLGSLWPFSLFSSYCVPEYNFYVEDHDDTMDPMELLKEAKRERQRKAEEERKRFLEERQKKEEEERKKLLEERQKKEEEHKRLLDEKRKKEEIARKKFLEDKKRKEEERKRKKEAHRKLLEETKKIEEVRIELLEEGKKAEEGKTRKKKKKQRTKAPCKVEEIEKESLESLVISPEPEDEMGDGKIHEEPYKELLEEEGKKPELSSSHEVMKTASKKKHKKRKNGQKKTTVEEEKKAEGTPKEILEEKVEEKELDTKSLPETHKACDLDAHEKESSPKKDISLHPFVQPITPVKETMDTIPGESPKIREAASQPSFIFSYFKSHLEQIKSDFLRSIKKHIGDHKFDPAFRYDTVLASFSESRRALFQEILIAFEKDNPLPNGERVDHVMTFLELGSGSHKFCLPSSDIEFVVFLREMKSDYLSWLSKFTKIIRDVGFILDKEHLFPAVVTEETKSILFHLEQGSLFATLTPEAFLPLHEMIIERDPRFGIFSTVSPTASSMLATKSFSSTDSVVWKLFTQSRVPSERRISPEGVHYFYDPTRQNIENMIKAMSFGKHLYGATDLWESFNEGKKETFRNLTLKYKEKLESARYKTFEEYFLANVRFHYAKFSSKKSSVGMSSLNIRDQIYRPLQLVLSYKSLILENTPSLSDMELSKHLDIFANYTAFLRLLQEDSDGTFTAVNAWDFEKSLWPVYAMLNQLLMPQ